MKVYLSGPIQGHDNASARFERAATVLHCYGHEVVNPFMVPACSSPGMTCEGRGEVLPSGHTWHCYMRHDIMAMLQCDTIAMLPGWESRHGARLELNVAAACGLAVWTKLEDGRTGEKL